MTGRIPSQLAWNIRVVTAGGFQDLWPVSHAILMAICGWRLLDYGLPAAANLGSLGYEGEIALLIGFLGVPYVVVTSRWALSEDGIRFGPLGMKTVIPFGLVDRVSLPEDSDAGPDLLFPPIDFAFVILSNQAWVSLRYVPLDSAREVKCRLACSVPPGFGNSRAFGWRNAAPTGSAPNALLPWGAPMAACLVASEYVSEGVAQGVVLGLLLTLWLLSAWSDLSPDLSRRGIRVSSLPWRRVAVDEIRDVTVRSNWVMDPSMGVVDTINGGLTRVVVSPMTLASVQRSIRTGPQ